MLGEREREESKVDKNTTWLISLWAWMHEDEKQMDFSPASYAITHTGWWLAECCYRHISRKEHWSYIQSRSDNSLGIKNKFDKFFY